MSRLKDKKLHNNLQILDYTYNIRGWLTAINNPDIAHTNDRLFAMRLYYNEDLSALNGGTLYNGNISGIKWRAYNNNAGDLYKGYGYQYDGLNRLTKGDYGTWNGSAWTNTTAYDETIGSYDANGNIGTMQRNNSSGTNRDNFTYTYNGNQLTSITGSLSGNYSYDNNENATSDRLHGLTIAYNNLNLPKSYTKDANNSSVYSYDASETKWSKTATIAGAATTTSYYGGFIYAGGTLTYVLTSEGFVKSNGEYHYDLKDHLGDTRISFYYSGTTPTVEQEDEYYPFGLLFTQNNVNKNPYLYNGKEIQNEFFENYDYGARFYDPQIGRWHVVDPKAEKYSSWSPYVYCLDNPLRYIDPNGKDVYSVDKDGNIKLKRRNNKDYDRIKAKGTLFNSIKVDKNVMAGMKTKTINTVKDGTVSLTKFHINGAKKGESFFQFMAKNTNVEWSNVKVGEGDWNTKLGQVIYKGEITVLRMR
ncbi:MAG: RHS repeat-associated core domain-containing protein [Bacteroidota bacterium]|nr:RHS repeat-associated core domain-containing protein [Bacteroidota bacterium]